MHTTAQGGLGARCARQGGASLLVPPAPVTQDAPPRPAMCPPGWLTSSLYPCRRACPCHRSLQPKRQHTLSAIHPANPRLPAQRNGGVTAGVVGHPGTSQPTTARAAKLGALPPGLLLHTLLQRPAMQSILGQPPTDIKGQSGHGRGLPPGAQRQVHRQLRARGRYRLLPHHLPPGQEPQGAALLPLADSLVRRRGSRHLGRIDPCVLVRRGAAGGGAAASHAAQLQRRHLDGLQLGGRGAALGRGGQLGRRGVRQSRGGTARQQCMTGKVSGSLWHSPTCCLARNAKTLFSLLPALEATPLLTEAPCWQLTWQRQARQQPHPRPRRPAPGRRRRRCGRPPRPPSAGARRGRARQSPAASAASSPHPPPPAPDPAACRRRQRGRRLAVQCRRSTGGDSRAAVCWLAWGWAGRRRVLSRKWMGSRGMAASQPVASLEALVEAAGAVELVGQAVQGLFPGTRKEEQEHARGDIVLACPKRSQLHATCNETHRRTHRRT